MSSIISRTTFFLIVFFFNLVTWLRNVEYRMAPSNQHKNVRERYTVSYHIICTEISLKCFFYSPNFLGMNEMASVFIFWDSSRSHMTCGQAMQNIGINKKKKKKIILHFLGPNCETDTFRQSKLFHRDLFLRQDLWEIGSVFVWWDWFAFICWCCFWSFGYQWIMAHLLNMLSLLNFAMHLSCI